MPLNTIYILVGGAINMKLYLYNVVFKLKKRQKKKRKSRIKYKNNRLLQNAITENL